jgi:hypothetical protein
VTHFFSFWFSFFFWRRWSPDEPTILYSVQKPMHKILGDAFRIDYRSCKWPNDVQTPNETRKKTQSWVDWLGKKTAVDFSLFLFWKYSTGSCYHRLDIQLPPQKKISLGRSIHHRRLVRGHTGINVKQLLCVCVCVCAAVNFFEDWWKQVAQESRSSRHISFICPEWKQVGRSFILLLRSRFTLSIYIYYTHCVLMRWAGETFKLM